MNRASRESVVNQLLAEYMIMKVGATTSVSQVTCHVLDA